MDGKLLQPSTYCNPDDLAIKPRECYVFVDEIKDDVKLCIEDYLTLRNRGMQEERGTRWFGWYRKKLEHELRYLKEGEKPYINSMKLKEEKRLEVVRLRMEEEQKRKKKK